MKQKIARPPTCGRTRVVPSRGRCPWSANVKIALLRGAFFASCEIIYRRWVGETGRYIFQRYQMKELRQSVQEITSGQAFSVMDHSKSGNNLGMEQGARAILTLLSESCSGMITRGKWTKCIRSCRTREEGSHLQKHRWNEYGWDHLLSGV